MEYSPKLKMAMEEIKAVLDKYDIAGIVALHNIELKAEVSNDTVGVEGFSESLFKINPSYPAASNE